MYAEYSLVDILNDEPWVGNRIYKMRLTRKQAQKVRRPTVTSSQFDAASASLRSSFLDGSLLEEVSL